MSGEEHSERLMDLEIKVAYLEKLVAELDGVVREQATLVARLATALEQRGESSGVEVGAPLDEKPPHY